MIRLTFRAKLDEFAGGKGYKVPKIRHSHVVATVRDARETLFVGGLNNEDVTRSRLRNMLGDYWPGVVFIDAPGAFTIEPDPSGFMATVSVELDAANLTRKGTDHV